MAKAIPTIGLMVPDILLPKTNVDLSKRAVVACDQYTSEPQYWEEVASIAGDAPSTLNITYPEVYLEDPDKPERIAAIQQAMASYMQQGILESHNDCFFLIDRKTSHAASRKGLIVALDLEAYDFSEGSQTLIRATEGTIVDRLPPRIQIRKGASIETPHIMVLIDDENQTVIEPLYAQKDQYTKVYETDLMMNGGHIAGYKIDNLETINKVITALTQLAQPEVFQKKYGVGPEKGVLLFAMGDGNHSFATAKAIREEKKKTLTPEQQATHPARYALVELINVHDTSLTFEPIHRVIFNIDPVEVLDELKKYLESQGMTVDVESYASEEQRQSQLQKSDQNDHFFTFVHQGTRGQVHIHEPRYNLEIGNLQAFLDNYMQFHLQAKLDYVHGDEATERLGMTPGNIAFLLPIMDKNDFFKTVVLDGALPRKTFSMGEAEEKRFYLECRKISE